MAAWIKVWGGYVSAGELPARADTTQSQSSLGPDIIMILAGMAISCVKGGGNAD
jgi:hypothetical protein